MKKNTFNFWVDLASLVVLFAVVFTGLLIHYVLPPCDNCAGAACPSQVASSCGNAAGGACPSQAVSPSANAAAGACPSQAASSCGNAAGGACPSQAVSPSANAAGTACPSQAASSCANAAGGACPSQAVSPSANAAGTACPSQAVSPSANAAGTACPIEGQVAANAEPTLWGLGRHDYGNIHFKLSIVVILLMILHLILHWPWVCATMRKAMKVKAGRSDRNTLYGIVLLVLSVVLVAGSLHWLKTQI